MKRHRLLLLPATFVALAPMLFGAGKSEPAQPDSYNYRRGVEAYDEGDRELATQYFNKELSDNPKNGYAWIYAASISEGNGEVADALKFYTNALKYIPKGANSMRRQAYGNRSSIYLELKDTVRALEDLSMAVKENKEDVATLATRGNLYRVMKQYDKAMDDFNRIRAVDEFDISGIIGIGRVHNDLKEWNEAIARFDRAATLAPRNPQPYSFRADSYIGKKEWAKAADDLIKAVEYQDEFAAGQIARDLPSEMKPVMLTKLRVAAKKDGSNVMWPFLAGVIEFNNNHYGEAVALLKEANAIDGNPAFLQAIADCYLRAGVPDRGEMYIRRAYAIDTSDPAGFYGYMSRIATAADDIPAALEWCDSIIEAAPDAADSYFGRGFVKFEAGNDSLFRDALADIDMGLTLNPDDRHAMLWKGDWLRLSGRPDEAAELYRKVVDLAAPDDSTSYAYAASSLGMADEAIRHVMTDVQKDSLSQSALYNAACIYARLGRNDEALAFVGKAVDNGYADARHLVTDHDFWPLRGSEAFEAVAARVRERQQANRRELRNRFPDDFAADSAVADIDVEEIVEACDTLRDAYEVTFTRKNGVTEVQCAINGLPLYFVFDTGASDVTISQTEASFMMKNNYLSPKDVVGSQTYMDANGNVSTGTLLNLKRVNFGGLVLDNVRATVVANQRAPLLLGQSVLGRLGTVNIDNAGRRIVITPIR